MDLHHRKSSAWHHDCYPPCGVRNSDADGWCSLDGLGLEESRNGQIEAPTHNAKASKRDGNNDDRCRGYEVVEAVEVTEAEAGKVEMGGADPHRVLHPRDLADLGPVSGSYE